MTIPHFIHQLSGLFLVLALLITTFCIIFKWKKIFSYFEEVPKSLLGINVVFLIWGLFAVPKNFSGRGEFGVWMMSRMNLSSWSELLLDVRAPIYHLRNKLFSEILDGISYEFVASLNFLGFFISVILIYILVKNLTKNEKSAYASSLFFLISPIIFTFSLTEDYALLALFFMILSLFFASLRIDSGDSFFLIPAMSSALLAAGSRVEYIFFPYIFILFYLIFIREKSYKPHLARLLTFILFILPRTVATAGMYFADAQHDVALHGTTYKYEGSPLSYIFEIIIGSSHFFIQNIKDVLPVLSNPYNLTGIFLILGILALFSLFFKKKTNPTKNKLVIFLSLQFLFIVFYYSYFHAVGGIRAYRYMVTVITPLIILAGIGFSFLFGKRDVLFYSGLQIITFFVFITVLFPLGFRDNTNLMIDNDLKMFVTHDHDQVRREYYTYKDLEYENKITRLFNKKFDVSSGENSYFITNSERNLLHSMPVNGNFFPVRSAENLEKIVQLIPPESNVYASQSEMGFTSHMIDGYKAADPEEFEKEIKNLFEIEKELVSYEIKGHHAFLYKLNSRTGQ